MLKKLENKESTFKKARSYLLQSVSPTILDNFIKINHIHSIINNEQSQELMEKIGTINNGFIQEFQEMGKEVATQKAKMEKYSALNEVTKKMAGVRNDMVQLNRLIDKEDIKGISSFLKKIKVDTLRHLKTMILVKEVHDECLRLLELIYKKFIKKLDISSPWETIEIIIDISMSLKSLKMTKIDEKDVWDICFASFMFKVKREKAKDFLEDPEETILKYQILMLNSMKNMIEVTKILFEQDKETKLEKFKQIMSILNKSLKSLIEEMKEIGFGHKKEKLGIICQIGEVVEINLFENDLKTILVEFRSKICNFISSFYEIMFTDYYDSIKDKKGNNEICEYVQNFIFENFDDFFDIPYLKKLNDPKIYLYLINNLFKGIFETIVQRVKQEVSFMETNNLKTKDLYLLYLENLKVTFNLLNFSKDVLIHFIKRYSYKKVGFNISKADYR